MMICWEPAIVVPGVGRVPLTIEEVREIVGLAKAFGSANALSEMAARKQIQSHDHQSDASRE